MFAESWSRSAQVLVAVALSLIFPMVGAEAQSVSRGPYLQMGTSSSVVVRWRTSSSTNSVVRYGLSRDNLDQTSSVSGSRREHQVSLSGLSAATRYYYSVGNAAGPMEGGDSATYFETSPVTGATDPTRIWVIGDSGTGNSNAAAVYNAYRSYTGANYTDLWLMLGDNAYNDGTDSEYQDAVFDTYPELLRQTVVWSTLGNHDGYSADSASESGPYYDIFTLPRQGEAGGVASGTEAYYSFDHANIHFVVLDSYETNRNPGGAMLTWLQADLAATTADWLIAFWHHPPYTKGSHNSDSESALIDMRENALPILESHGVDLVLSGHSHSYERSFLLDGHHGSSSSLTGNMILNGGDGRPDGNGAYGKATEGIAPHEGAVYIVAGSSGKTSGGSLNHPAMFISLNQLGSVVLDVDDLTLDAKFVNASGSVTDYFTVIKGDGNGCTVVETSEHSCGDGQDNDCDGLIDGADTDCCPDADGDGYNGAQCGGTDCDDSDGSVSPGALEVCSDGVDNDCNATADCADVACTGDPACCADDDGDGHTAQSCGGPDCDDSDATSHPGAAEQCSDGADNNCNGLVDCAEASCAGVGGCPSEPRVVIVTDVSDTFVRDSNPNSNYGGSGALEVDTASTFKYALVKPNQLADIEPGAQVVRAELVFTIFDPGDAVAVHEVVSAWSEGSATYNNAPSVTGAALTTFAGSPTREAVVDITTLAQGWVNSGTANGVQLYPTGSNGVDIRSSEYGTSSARPYFVFEVRETGSGGCGDADNDGHSDSACGGNDCDDADAMVYPGAGEVCDDGVDNDCDADTDCEDSTCGADPVCCGDGDGDGYTAASCGGPDCDDGNPSIHPGATEICSDGADNDCNGAVDCEDGSCSDAGACSGGGTPRTVLLTSIDDAYVRNNRRNNNYGNSTSLEMDTASTFKHAFVRPRSLADIEPGAQVLHAELVLRIHNVGDTVQVREVLGSWSEGGITWNNAPATSAPIGSFGADSTGEVSVDVTVVVQDWVNGAPLHGVNLYPTGSNGVDIRSSEYGTSAHRPYFVVEVIE